MIKTLFMAIGAVLDALFKSIPLYEQISGIKDELIASVLGIPAIVLSLISLFL